MAQMNTDKVYYSDTEQAWKEGCASLIPEKSKRRYELAYEKFMKWVNDKKTNVNEKTLLAYFVRRGEILKSPGSLWSEFSMLKTMINLELSINIGRYYKLVSFLKRKNVGFVPKKSKVFLFEEINKFMVEAPNDKYLMLKVVMIMGVAGACRREELVKMTINDIEDKGAVVIVNLPNTKTNITRSFTITKNKQDNVDFVEIFRKYVEVRPKGSQYIRFFYAYNNGKCSKQVVGINTMGKIPSVIAKYLQLEDPNSYSGHSFRRTSATLLVNAGADTLALKRHGGWKSTAVAEGYVENSMKTKVQFANKILHNRSGNESPSFEESARASTSGVSVKKIDSSCPIVVNNNEGVTAEDMSISSNNRVPIVFNNCVNCSITFNNVK